MGRVNSNEYSLDLDRIIRTKHAYLTMGINSGVMIWILTRSSSMFAILSNDCHVSRSN